MDHIGSDLTVRPDNEFLDLAAERVDRPRPTDGCQRVRAGVADRNITGDRLLVDPGQPSGGVRAAGQVERFQDAHDLPVRFGQGDPSRTWSALLGNERQPAEDTLCLDVQARHGDLMSISPEWQVHPPGPKLSVTPNDTSWVR